MFASLFEMVHLLEDLDDIMENKVHLQALQIVVLQLLVLNVL